MKITISLAFIILAFSSLAFAKGQITYVGSIERDTIGFGTVKLTIAPSDAKIAGQVSVSAELKLNKVNYDCKAKDGNIVLGAPEDDGEEAILTNLELSCESNKKETLKLTIGIKVGNTSWENGIVSLRKDKRLRGFISVSKGDKPSVYFVM
jgi:hypothetical protein